MSYASIARDDNLIDSLLDFEDPQVPRHDQHDRWLMYEAAKPLTTDAYHRDETGPSPMWSGSEDDSSTSEAQSPYYSDSTDVDSSHSSDSDSDRGRSPSATDWPVTTIDPRHLLEGPASLEPVYTNTIGSRVSLRPRRASRRHQSYSESEDGSSEDEYQPFPSPRPQKRGRSPSVVRAPQKAAKRPRASPRSRNVQVAAKRPSSQDAAAMKKVWGCPHCPFVQQNRRRPDLNRHINTHMRSNNWVCCGVPVAYAAEYGIGPTAKQVEFKGRMRVGGCFKTFSRRDALKRHVDNRSIGCIGDLSLHPSTGNIV